MRSSEQIKRTPAEWADHKAGIRSHALVELLRELGAARARGEEWIEWLADRAARRHRHGLRDELGRLVACPAPGCDHGRGDANPHLRGSSRSDRREPPARSS